MTALPLIAALAGCNRYELFRIAGYEQESFNNKADVLFVIDNSDSMLIASESLAVNFAGFITNIDAVQQQLSYEGLPDAVTNYVDYVQNRTAYVDYQFAITTTDPNVEAGETVGPVVRRGDENVPERFIENLACEATCFSQASILPSDPEYQCGDPLGGFLSEEYMDCTCSNSYIGNCGTAKEEGLESVFLALCRAVPNPPDDCFADVDNGEEQFPAILSRSDLGTNEDLLREEANLIVVVVSDEGDSSRRQLREAIPDQYEALFKKFRKRITWVYVGPAMEPDYSDVRCPGTATAWGATRYHYMASVTGGRAIDLFDGACVVKDFQQTLEELGTLLTNLLTEFPLQSVPVPDTLVVLVDGKRVDPAEVTGQDYFGLDLYSDGWSYRTENNTVSFHGAAIPNYDAKVEIYYLPVDGMPRDLPF